MSKPVSPAQRRFILKFFSATPAAIFRQNKLHGGEWITARKLNELGIVGMKWPLFWLTNEGVEVLKK